MTKELELVFPSAYVRNFPDPVRHLNHYQFLPRAPDDDGTFLRWGTTLSDADWKHMSHYCGAYAFMQDDALDMALKVLAHNIDAPAHGIGIVTSVEIQTCRFQGDG